MKECSTYLSARRTLGGVPVQGFSEDFAYDLSNMCTLPIREDVLNTG